MFRGIISNTPWSSRSNVEVFKGIPYHSENEDESLISTLRALLFPRLPEFNPKTDKPPILIYTTDISINTSLSDNRVIQQCRDAAVVSENYLCFIGVRDDRHNRDEEKKDAFELMESLNFSGFKEVERVKVFFQKTIKVRCFINPEIKTTVVYYEKKGMDTQHYLQCVIPVYLPWYFQEHPINPEGDPDEFALITSLRLKTKDEYLAALNKLAEKYDIADRKADIMLRGFGNSWAVGARDSLKRQITDKRGKIETKQKEVAALLIDIRNQEVKLIGIEARIKNSQDEFADYFKGNKSLEFVEVSETRIEFLVKTYLEFYDEELADKCIRNTDSSVYDETPWTFEATELLFRAIFIDKKYKIRITAAYYLDIGCYEVRGISGYCFPLGFNYMPNTHIQNYHCLGGYEENMIEALKNNDMITAVELCCASARSLNFADGTVMEHFVPDLLNYKNPCIELDDGSIVTATEALNKLKGTEESHEKEAEE